MKKALALFSLFWSNLLCFIYAVGGLLSINKCWAMIRKKKKAYYVKKEVAKATPYNPMNSRQSIGGSKYSKSDSKGTYSSVRKLVYISLAFFLFWIIKESLLSINIFQ